MDAFTVNYFSTLYFTSTNKNWCAFLELIFLAYLFRQLFPMSCSCLKSSVQEIFFRERGRKENIADDHSQFCHLTICLLCTWTFFLLYVFFCFLKLFSSLLNIDGFVQCNMNWVAFVFRSLCYIKRCQSSMHTRLGSESNSIAAVFLGLSVLRNFSGELFAVNFNVWHHCKAVWLHCY